MEIDETGRRAAWAANQPTGSWHVYVNRITLPCTAAADASGMVNTLDPLAFALAYGTQQPNADVNHNGAINAADIMDFWTGYARGVCTVP